MFLFLLAFAFAEPEADLQAAANASLSEKARADAFERLVELGNTDISLVRRTSVDTDSDMRQRWVSIRVLGQVGGQIVLQHLVSLLQDTSPDIRTAAVSALGDIRSWSTTDSLIPLLKDDVLVVRATTAQALGKIGDPASLPALEQALNSSEHYHRGQSLWIRSHFVVAMGKIRDKKAYPALFRALDDVDVSVVRASIQALEYIAGFSLSEDRSFEDEREAWRRWLGTKLSE